MIETTLIAVAPDNIKEKIYTIRGMSVMLDRDLSELYDVKTKVLKQSVKRNLDRFPEDFMFQLSDDEFKYWRSQIVTSSSGDKMGLRYPPFAFSENGVAMLSSVLRSQKAIQVNIQIMRVFTLLRKQALTHTDILRKLEEIDKKLLTQNVVNKKNDQQFKVIFEAIKHIIYKEENPNKIGFITD